MGAQSTAPDINNLCAAAVSAGRRSAKVMLREVFRDSLAAGPGARKHPRPDIRADVLSGSLTTCQCLKDSSRRVALRFRFVTRFAVSSSADVFHLLTESQDRTLCGLSVVPIIINRPVRSSTLYLTEIVEAARQPCEKCAAIAFASRNPKP